MSIYCSLHDDTVFFVHARRKQTAITSAAHTWELKFGNAIWIEIESWCNLLNNFGRWLTIFLNLLHEQYQFAIVVGFRFVDVYQLLETLALLLTSIAVYFLKNEWNEEL
jgi:hypothetical protein